MHETRLMDDQQQARTCARCGQVLPEGTEHIAFPDIATATGTTFTNCCYSVQSDDAESDPRRESPDA